AGNVAVRQVLANAARRFDELHGVVVVLVDAGGDREYVRIEDDVCRRETDFPRQDVVGALADLELPIGGVGLPLLVERHDDDGGTVAADQLRLLYELLLTLLQADRIDDRLPLHALQPGLDHRPLRGVDHHRNATDVGLGGDQAEEFHHRRLGVEHALVHVDVDNLGAVLDLVARDCQGAFIVAGDDQLAETGGAGDVRPLADIYECAVHATNSNGSSPERRRPVGLGGISRGATPSTAAAIARMWSGVVPQQPPTMLTRPARAHSPICAAVCSGVSS